MSTLTQRERSILVAISTGLNGQRTADSIALRIGYRPAKTGRLAVSSNLRRLQRLELVGRIAPRDQWSSAIYFLTANGEAMLAEVV